MQINSGKLNKSRSLKVGILAVSLVFNAGVANAGTTTADFLKWERKSQDAFFQNAIGMTGVIASQTKPSVAKCIDGWYHVNAATKAMRHTEILKIMPEYQEFTPHEVLLAYLENVCGQFDRKG